MGHTLTLHTKIRLLGNEAYPVEGLSSLRGEPLEYQVVGIVPEARRITVTHELQIEVVPTVLTIWDFSDPYDLDLN